MALRSEYDRAVCGVMSLMRIMSRITRHFPAAHLSPATFWTLADAAHANCMHRFALCGKSPTPQSTLWSTSGVFASLRSTAVQPRVHGNKTLPAPAAEGKSQDGAGVGSDFTVAPQSWARLWVVELSRLLWQRISCAVPPLLRDGCGMWIAVAALAPQVSYSIQFFCYLLP